jgi:lysophospholipase L1-like esterase
MDPANFLASTPQFEAIDMTYDGLHPSDKGYEVIARKLVKVLK